MKFKKIRKLFGQSIKVVEIVIKNTLTDEETTERFDSMKEVPKKYNKLKIAEINQIKFGISIKLRDGDFVATEDFNNEDED